MEIITKLDKYGNVNADFVEVTALISGKNKVVPPPKPLTEVVEAVANRHQEAGYLPSTKDNLPSTAENASGEFGNSSRLSVAPDDAFVQAWAKVLLPVVSTQYINVDGVAAYLMDHGIEVYAGRDDDTLRKACVLAQTWKKERNKVVRGNREHKALEKKDPYYKILSGKFGRDFQINAGPKYDGTVFTGTWMDKHKTEKGRSGSITAAEAAKILTEATGKEVTEGVVVWWNRQGGR